MNPKDLPDGPAVKSLPRNAGDTNSIPGPGTKIPHAMAKKKFNVNSNFLTTYLFVPTSKEYIDRFKEFHLQCKTFLYTLLYGTN